MDVTPALNLRLPRDTAPGSLVLVPDAHQWGIASGSRAIILLDGLRSITPEGLVGDAGLDYLLSIDNQKAVRLGYPWGRKAERGWLCLFSAAGQKTEYGIWYGLEGLELRVLDLRSGTLTKRKPEVSEGMGFPEWRLGIRHSAEVGGYWWAYRFLPRTTAFTRGVHG